MTGAENWKLGHDSQIFVGSRRELVANSIHTADADATPTRLNSTVESRRRRRCVLGITVSEIFNGECGAMVDMTLNGL